MNVNFSFSKRGLMELHPGAARHYYENVALQKVASLRETRWASLFLPIGQYRQRNLGQLGHVLI